MQGLPRFRSVLLAGTALVLPVAAAAQTLAPNTAPVLDRVVAGGITVQQGTAQTVVNQAQQRGIVEWRSFNIGQDHHVRFQQPGTSSVTLNRVTTPDPSVIAGRITANGQIAIVNQSGVVFTQGAQVNAAGLVVSSANITNENFLAGRMVFDQAGRPDARIENAGTITVRETGLAALVAPQVANRGTISARLGRVSLAGAETHVVDLYGDGLLSIEVTGAVRQAPSGGAALVTNTGVIEAVGGTVQITAAAADGIVQDLVRAGGRISADTDATTGRAGQITISGTGGAVRVEGEVRAVGTASGTRGGRIEVVADRVLIDRGARVDASGEAGGGEVAVGTTLRGAANPRLARRAGIVQGATVRADATGRGQGGTVIVNSADYTAHGGTISARGGPQGGDGGFVEVSGQGGLLVLGSIDTGAPAGAPGTILIDPVDLTIIAENDTLPGADQASLTGNVLGAEDPPDNAFLYPSQFESLTGDVILEASNDITVNAAINRVGGGLTLDAGRDIAINAPITGDGALTLDAGRNLTINAGLQSAGALDLFARTGDMFLGGGQFIGGGNALTAVAGGSITTDTVIDGFQGISLAAQAGNVLLDTNAALRDAEGGAGVSIVAGNAILINGGFSTGGPAISSTEVVDLQAGAGGISQTGSIRAGTLQVRTTGSALLGLVPVDTMPGNQVGTLADSDVAGDFLLRSTELSDVGAPLTVSGLVRVGGGLTLEPLTGVTQSAPSVIETAQLAVTTDSGINLAGDNRIGTVAELTAGDQIYLRNTGSLTVAGPVTVESGGNAIIGIDVVGGDLTVAAPILATAAEGFGLVSLTASGNLALTAAGSVTVDALAANLVRLAAAMGESGSVDPSLPGALSLAGNVSAPGGAVILEAGQGGITQTAGGITTGSIFVTSGGDALLGSSANAIQTLSSFEVAGDFLLDNGLNDLLVETGPSYETLGTAGTIGLRTGGTVLIAEGAAITATGDAGRASFRVGALEVEPDALVTAALVEIAPFAVTPMRIPIATPNAAEFGVTAETLSRMSFQTLRLGATTFDGALTTTADGLTIAAALTIPGTLDLRSLTTIAQEAGADLVVGTLTGASGGTTLLENPGNAVTILAGFEAGGDFRLLSQGPLLSVPGGTTVSAGGALVIDVTGGELLVDGTVTGATTSLLAGTALTVNGFSAIARSGSLLLRAPAVTLAGLAAAAGNIVIEASLAANLAGIASTGNALLIVSPTVTFGGLDARTADVRIDLGSTGFAQGALDAGGLLVQGGRGAALTGTIAGIAGPAAAARGRRADAGGTLLPDPPPQMEDFTFNACPIGASICGVPLVPLPLANPAAVLAVLDPALLLAAVDQLRPPTPDLSLQPTRDPTEESELAPPDIRGGDY
ncbi:filamentous hemagglutinin N-terminal domain-containing protein [Roseomonas eburnea]|uniref:Filamentous hemagglutinin N-terminal domain-containing protein n=1 Tax=Neoroseomonas eburnea TaxID=1346889 RepID=A0A9X9XFX5_9PROT|nr:filamentous hemagglutinin N-terminal domain-containing protein [Neoroseomonas eburnea]MBR0682611.1 filamentous hemagglutinin N-terminal domain-containing protein [Neoroseomonas eburnea]